NITMKKLKDIGLQELVPEMLPYANVGGAWIGSFQNPIGMDDYYTALSHVVPAGHQLKILFLRIFSENDDQVIFSIVQTNPAAAGLTGAVEAFPVVGSVPPFTAGLTATRDYPMLEAPGAEILRGSLVDPVHVLEGSIDFRVEGPTPIPATGGRYGIVWWGVEKNVPE
ncbi:unnamed protein product, partial [marine sediment metagenome]